MKTYLVILFLVVFVPAIMLAVIRTMDEEKRKAERGAIKPRAVLTEHEQLMYFRLKEALPEYIVLCQVSFSALIDSRLQATRNTFDRKVADFVICKRSFGVVAIVELDDSSHRGKEQKDASRDALLKNAGYKVVRYRRLPEADVIRADLKEVVKPKTERPAQQLIEEKIEPTI